MVRILAAMVEALQHRLGDLLATISIQMGMSPWLLYNCWGSRSERLEYGDVSVVSFSFLCSFQI